MVRYHRPAHDTMLVTADQPGELRMPKATVGGGAR
jgi:hypothetical protein